MFSQRVINAVALAITALFIFQSGWDLVKPEYEVPGAMYGLMTIVVSGVIGTAVGSNIGKGRNGRNGNGGAE